MHQKFHRSAALLFLACAAAAGAAEIPADRFGAADIARLADVSEPAFAPDGESIVYTVTVTNAAEDRLQSDLWQVDYHGRERTQLTSTPKHDEWAPAWSPDGRWLAFLADRGDDGAKTQVWAMPARGGEARALTSLPGGVEDFVWSPDGRQLVLVAADADRPAGVPKPKHPPPIVTDRYRFKQDIVGYLGAQRKHLYLYELATGQVAQLTSGDHDEAYPSWSPDGRQIAYLTRRGEDPDRHSQVSVFLIEPRAGSSERLLTLLDGADSDALTAPRPQWSPDGRKIAFLQGGEETWIYYAPLQLAIVDVANGAVTLPAPIDRWFSAMHWSPDGTSVLALVEQSRVIHLARIDIASGKVTPLTTGPRLDAGFAVSRQGRIVVLGGDDVTPYELAALEKGGKLRPLGSHNAWLAQKQLARLEEITFKSADGTSIDGFVIKPAGYVAGRRYPTLLRLHGGPVYQFSHEFMDDWQVFAAQGYVVVGANPRGSSGRGFDFARAIYADWGNKDVQDVLAAVDHVVAAGVADPARLGVGGYSYGGILTNYVIASDTRFKAAASGAGGAHWAALYGHDMYTREYELELGRPWEKSELYDRLSYPFLNVDRIKTPTLYYCAEQDFNVPCNGSEQMYQALRSLGVPTRLVIYPGEHHSLLVPSYRQDRLQRLLDWYGQYLPAVPGAAP